MSHAKSVRHVLGEVETRVGKAASNQQQHKIRGTDWCRECRKSLHGFTDLTALVGYHENPHHC